MAGYSWTPLPKKLGIKPGMEVMALEAPGDIASILGELPDGARLKVGSRASGAELVLWFVTRRDLFERRIDRVFTETAPGGAVWVAWPKKASGQPTDMSGDAVREEALFRGWVDVKVCAVDETWSALRLGRRKDTASTAHRGSPR